jgi:hypothetical protein
MNGASVAATRARPAGLRVWHLSLLSVLVAVAIVNIQDQRRTEPALIALAAGGFVLYTVLGWAGWRVARQFRHTLGEVPLVVLYLAAMAALFFVATVVYLLLEHLYLYGP